jgi:hypothetical protein
MYLTVKAITRHAWQFDIRTVVNMRLDGTRQVMGAPTRPPSPDLVCVFVRLWKYGADEFYVMTWKDFQKIAMDHHREYLARHDGIRPKKYDSFHAAIRPEMMAEHRDKWGVLESRFRDDV